MLTLVLEEEGQSIEILRIKLSGVLRVGDKSVEDILGEVMGDMARKALEIR